MKHLDLFSGIGGFAYAAQQIWGAEYENVGFVEIDPFCQNVLRKNFPGVPIFADVRDVAYAEEQGVREVAVQWQPDEKDTHIDGRIELITGGFPCQSFSQAGQRRGTDDNRYLWPEMYAVIRRFQPEWVIAENVSGLITWQQGVVFDTVCADLEAAGYEVQPFVIPAAAVGAPHRRDRIWFVANSPSVRRPRRPSAGTGTGSRLRSERRDTHAADTGEARLQGYEQPGTHGEEARASRPAPERSWEENWPEVATRLCRVDDGLPRRMVRLPDGSTITEAKWREKAISAYGNAIVPQVAMEIMKAIKEQKQ